MGFEINGKTLKELRERLGRKTQEEFAVMIGTNQATYSKWERDENVPSGRYAMRIFEIATGAGLQGSTDIPDIERKSENLSIQANLLAEADTLGIDISRVAEEAIASAVSAAKSRLWKEENREAIESSNAYFEKHGLPLAKYRMF